MLLVFLRVCVCLCVCVCVCVLQWMESARRSLLDATMYKTVVNKKCCDDYTIQECLLAPSQKCLWQFSLHVLDCLSAPKSFTMQVISTKSCNHNICVALSVFNLKVGCHFNNFDWIKDAFDGKMRLASRTAGDARSWGAKKEKPKLKAALRTVSVQLALS